MYVSRYAVIECVSYCLVCTPSDRTHSTMRAACLIFRSLYPVVSNAGQLLHSFELSCHQSVVPL